MIANTTTMAITAPSDRPPLSVPLAPASGPEGSVGFWVGELDGCVAWVGAIVDLKSNSLVHKTNKQEIKHWNQYKLCTS